MIEEKTIKEEWTNKNYSNDNYSYICSQRRFEYLPGIIFVTSSVIARHVSYMPRRFRDIGSLDGSIKEADGWLTIAVAINVQNRTKSSLPGPVSKSK